MQRRGGQKSPPRPLEKEKDSEDDKARSPQGSAAGGCSCGAAGGCGIGVLYAQPAEANYPGKAGKKIAYTGRDRNDWDIYTINPGGGSRFNVTNNKADDIQPSYSPSGKSIAYVYDPGAGDAEIYYIKPEGGGRTPVTNNIGQPVHVGT